MVGRLKAVIIGLVTASVVVSILLFGSFLSGYSVSTENQRTYYGQVMGGWMMGRAPYIQSGGWWMYNMMGWMYGCPCMGWASMPQVLPSPSSGLKNDTAPPDVELTIYGGESANKFGFGLDPSKISSPGPTIRVKAGSWVKINFVNSGRLLHVLLVTDVVKDDPNLRPAFDGAFAGLVHSPVKPGESAVALFKAERPGTYYYLCNIPGHVSLGMWGVLIVE